ncbi:YbjQ family protein [Salidesulfovibrio onnuriiensis]|uniref:YbjQ family protein n=1 Tax=Salidesulfovibrio onnuriiensis TaxID=2583823 RepID=UPI0011C99BD8|nr:YbjQ family protein [Salidesulfovibrio onnuriiensis]
MFVTNMESVPGMKIVKHHGMVTGSTVRARNIFVDIWQMIKGLFGGELKGYSALLSDVREQSVERMVLQAEEAGANAVINVRFATSTISLGAAEIYAYGTAVEVAEESKSTGTDKAREIIEQSAAKSASLTKDEFWEA